jgi:hypothetical protein
MKSATKLNEANRMGPFNVIQVIWYEVEQQPIAKFLKSAAAMGEKPYPRGHGGTQGNPVFRMG